eukprot:scaffold267772_cov28-Tisochrysis_lutea.AAC.1
MLGTDSSVLRCVVQARRWANLKLQPKDDKRWTAQLLQTFHGLHSLERSTLTWLKVIPPIVTNKECHDGGLEGSGC